MRPINFYVIANYYCCSGQNQTYVSAETDERAIEIAAEVFGKMFETCRSRERFYCSASCYDKTRIEIVHKLDGTVEGAVDTVDD